MFSAIFIPILTDFPEISGVFAGRSGTITTLYGSLLGIRQSFYGLIEGLGLMLKRRIKQKLNKRLF
jgi:hypothetical protein